MPRCAFIPLVTVSVTGRTGQDDGIRLIGTLIEGPDLPAD
jgi:hypothetical protein